MRTYVSLLTMVAMITITASTIAAVPNAPTALAATINGGTVSLTWNGPGGVVNAYVLEAGSAPGLSNAANAVVGVAPSYVATNVPPGVYFVRVRAVDGSGVGPASNEIQVTVGLGACAAPNPFQLLPASVNGTNVGLAWSSASGCAATTYTLQAGSFPGATNITAANVGAVLSFAAVAPPGTYYVRVVAQNAVGVSVSNEVIVVVGAVTPGTFGVAGSGDSAFNVPSSVTRVRIVAMTTASARGKVFSVAINGQLVISEFLGNGEGYDEVHNVPQPGGRIAIVASLDPTGLTWTVTAAQ